MSGYYEINVKKKDGETETVSPVLLMNFHPHRSAFAVFNGFHYYDFDLKDVESWSVELMKEREGSNG